ncbi:hypothetical protein BZA05DRAFT_410733 [Tricharina praecox]|uniref:uncharacterized protein n=1 Tax=Tricharina praecox TaxID=43433 RepID=UPI00221F0AD5|nr:uncharacterized protein BZA05DRAFT_414007 [Tricharina praecox]XP_051335544.1 uncharacterized protein BZA05DRAFT_410733 [Tricharina praecox]KAI5840597.1 hypothetical protein BZA05DRAFT_414007 [Tricharina praecox]KAI5843601.1 hypothetical protein BZA05DRAFT_410733 [Tricharina praecox]
MRLGYVYIPQEAVMNIGRDVAGDMRLVLRDDTMQLKTASLHVVKAKPDIRRSFRAVDEAGDAPMQMGWGQRNRITEADHSRYVFAFCIFLVQDLRPMPGSGLVLVNFRPIPIVRFNVGAIHRQLDYPDSCGILLPQLDSITIFSHLDFTGIVRQALVVSNPEAGAVTSSWFISLFTPGGYGGCAGCGGYKRSAPMETRIAK